MGILILTTLITIALIALVFSFFLVPDLIKYYGTESKRIYRDFKANDNNIGEVVAVLICSVLIGLAVFVFYKGTQSFFAYCLSGDLIDFFIKSRGVFSSSGVSRQNPFIVSNFIYGSILNPLIQMMCVFTLVEVTKYFMMRLNKVFRHDLFSATSLVYYSSFGILVFILLDVVSYLQSVSILNTFTNIVFLIGSKLAYLIIAFGIWHIQLMKNDNYNNALTTEINMSRFEKKLMMHPYSLMIFTYIVTALLNLPLFLGLQWNGSIWVVLLSLATGVGLFFILLKFTLSKGYNFIGVYMLDENREQPLPYRRQLYFFKKKTTLIIIISIVFFSLLLSVAGFFFYTFYLFIFCLVFFVTVFIGYVFLSLLNRSKIRWFIARQMFYSSIIALIPLFFIMLFVLILFSIYPKTLENSTFNNYQTAVVDKERNLVYKSNTKINNPSIPVSYDDIPKFFIKALLLKEDQSLFNQNNLIFNRTNWHGTSINFLAGRGGSNINQQLIKNLAFKGFFPQEFQRKYTELIASYQLSMSMNPETILTNYVNNVSFNGGMGHTGIVMSSYYTFGRNISQLNELEMLYLIFTLHRGSSFKVQDDHISYKEVHLYSSDVKEKLLIYAKNWCNKGLITKKELKKIRRQKLNFANSKHHLNNLASRNIFLKNQIPDGNLTGLVYTTTLSQSIDKRIKIGVDNFYNYFASQKKKGDLNLYGAALAVNVKTGEILGHYGGNTLKDLTAFGDGYPMGSLIKPFVLLELMEKSYSINLYDGKRRKRRVANNYNGRNSNKYKNATAILGQSLNTPMANIDEIAPIIPLFQSVEKKFNLMGIDYDNSINLEESSNYTWNRINYPLGSRRMTILNVAQAYQTLFNYGEFVELYSIISAMNPYTYRNESFRSIKKNLYTTSHTKVIQEALKTSLDLGGTAYSLNNILPKGRNYLAKTGTADKYRHGLTVLSDGEIMVVSWVSYGKVVNNQLKLGLAPIPNRSGGGSAGVLAAFILKEMINKKRLIN